MAGAPLFQQFTQENQKKKKNVMPRNEDPDSALVLAEQPLGSPHSQEIFSVIKDKGIFPFIRACY